MAKKYKALFGGTFNPVHIGHIRLAIEVSEYTSLPYAIESVDIIPCATPVFKDPQGLLPFSLRFDMLEAAFADLPGFKVSDVEGQRKGTSYTYHTLRHYAELFPENRLLFVLGMENLCDLPHWYGGLELLQLADFAVVPRAGGDEALFLRTISQNWPQAILFDEQIPFAKFDFIKEYEETTDRAHRKEARCIGGNIFFMPLPRIDVSATFVRKRWLNKGNIHMLMPKQSELILQQEQELAQKIWQEKP